MPNGTKYRVVTRGATRPGYNLSRVKRQFSTHFRVSDDLTDKLLGGKQICLKADLDARTAQAYLDRLTDMGLVAELQAMAGTSESGAPDETLELEEKGSANTGDEHDSIACPSCGSYQSRSPKCVYCGMVFDPAPRRAYVPAGKPDRQPRQPPQSFYEAIARAPGYPLSGSGPYIILGGALFLLFTSAVLWIPILGILFGLVTVGYLCSYMLDIVRNSALGKPTPPDWPEFQHWGHIFMPLLYLAGTFAFSFFPAIAYYGLFLSLPNRPDPAFWFLSALGVFYFPMALLAVALTRLFRAASPHFVIPSILRVWREYLLACGVMALAYGCSFVTRGLAGESIPVVGSFMGNALSIYFMLLEMRIIGALFFTHERELNWFD